MRVLSALGCAVVLSSSAASGATLHVPDDYATLAAAVDAAGNGDTIEVAAGTYTGDDNCNIAVGVSLVILAPDGPDVTIIDCGGSESSPRRAFLFRGYQYSVLEGFTIKNGYSPFDEGDPPHAHGGAVWFDVPSGGAELVGAVRDCHFVDNTAREWGGAIFVGNTSIDVLDCVFDGNDALMAHHGGGGAVMLEASGSTFTNCEFTGNGVSGISMLRQSDPVITSCVFNADSGPSITFSESSTPRIIGCTIYGSGGGIVGDNSTNQVQVSRTIISNVCPGPAVGCGPASTITLYCCDLFENCGGDWVDCAGGQEGVDGNFSADPLFCGPESGTLTLAANSPCLAGRHPDGGDCGAIGALGEGCPSTCIPQLVVGGDGTSFYRDCPVDVEVTIVGACDLGAFQFDLPFDESLLSFGGVTPGTFLESTGRTATYMDTLFPGRVAFGAYSFSPDDSPGPDGDGLLATFHFAAMESGHLTLTPEEPLVVDTRLLELPVTVLGAEVFWRSYIYGDFDNSCEVRVDDIMEVAVRWGAVEGALDYDPRFDVNPVPNEDYCSSRPDGVIDISDIQAVAGRWGSTCESRPVSAARGTVPVEPLGLQLDPSVIHGEIGEAHTVLLRASGALDLGGFEAVLGFDPDEIVVEEVSLGSLLSEGGNTAILLDDSDGNGQRAVGAFSFGNALGATGDGVLASIRLRIVGCTGDGELSLEAPKAVTMAGQELAVSAAPGARIVCGTTTLTEPAATVGPVSIRPNPTSGSAEVFFHLTDRQRIRVRLFDSAGRLVKVLMDQSRPAGGHRLVWDGKDDATRRVAPGVYFLEMEGRTRQRAKLLVTR